MNTNRNINDDVLLPNESHDSESGFTSLADERKEGNVLFNDTSIHFIYGYMASDSEREETRCRHMGYSFRLAARVLLYASSHRQDNTYHSLCCTSRGALAGTRNSSMGPTLADERYNQSLCNWWNALSVRMQSTTNCDQLYTTSNSVLTRHRDCSSISADRFPQRLIIQLLWNSTETMALPPPPPPR